MAESGSRIEGRYLYCVVDGNAETNFGQMGIEENLVYTLSYDDIGAVVHCCEAKPYRTTDAEKGKEWILAHEYVVDRAVKTFGTVVPLAFDTIFKGDDTAVREWLRKKHQPIKDLLRGLKGRDEYVVQVFLERSHLEKEVERDAEIQRLRRQVESVAKGRAYLLERRLEKRLEDKKRSVLDGYGRNCLDQVRGVADRVKVFQRNRGIPEEWKDKEVILNLSCLVHKDRVRELGSLLGEVNAKESFAVRFGGPWPPYSFVDRLESE